MCKGLWVLLITLALVSAGMCAPGAHAAARDDEVPDPALAQSGNVFVVNTRLTPLYRVPFMKSRTTDAIRTATVVSVTNQAGVSCDLEVIWFRGFDPNPVCTTSMSVDAGLQTDFCSRAIPDAQTTCNTPCTPDLTFHEGTAVVYSGVDWGNAPSECQNLAVSARV